MRKYSVTEIEDMRRSIEWMYPIEVSYYPAERTKETEEKLRTYMIAGITPRQLSKKASEHADREAKWYFERQELSKKMREANKSAIPDTVSRVEKKLLDSAGWTGLNQDAFRKGFTDIITLKPLRDCIAAIFR